MSRRLQEGGSRVGLFGDVVTSFKTQVPSVSLLVTLGVAFVFSDWLLGGPRWRPCSMRRSQRLLEGGGRSPRVSPHPFLEVEICGALGVLSGAVSAGVTGRRQDWLEGGVEPLGPQQRPWLIPQGDRSPEGPSEFPKLKQRR